MAANLKDRKARKVSPEEAIDITSQRSRTEAEKRFPGEIRYTEKNQNEMSIDTTALNSLSDAIYRDSYEDKRKKRN